MAIKLRKASVISEVFSVLGVFVFIYWYFTQAILLSSSLYFAIFFQVNES